MDLIERYLSAVGVLLPKDQCADITSELRDALMTRREEKETVVGRPLTSDEDADLLRAFGHPLAVAARYGRQHYLVGPELYPLYAFAIKAYLAIVAVSAVITTVVAAVVHPADPGRALGAGLGAFIQGVIYDFGVLTLIAALLERGNLIPKFLTDWSPRDLPSFPKRPLLRPRTRFDHAAGIVAHILFILWWTHAISFRVPYVTYVPLTPDQWLDLAPAPIWTDLFWPVLGLAIAILALHIVKLAATARGGYVHALDIFSRLAVVTVTGIALNAGHWIVVSGRGISDATLSRINHGVNLGFEISLTVVAVVSTGVAAYDAWSLYRPGKSSES